IKRLEILIEALKSLKERGKINFRCIIAGDCTSEIYRDYFKSIGKKILNYGLARRVEFIGPVPHKNIASFYKSSDIFVNLSDTDSLDKSVLESMSCGSLVLTSNKAFSNILTGDLSLFYLEKNNPAGLAEKIEILSSMTAEEKEAYGLRLRNIVNQKHSLSGCVAGIHSVIMDVIG
ncbi:MAG: glycosyltransferase family 4 protein, partial [bacterium]|nr:glycosyltransferase family 4 protein [bacterium]